MQGEDSEPGESKGADESRSTQSKKNALHSGETDSRKILGVDAVSALWTFGKCLGYLLPVYFAGYYRVSTSLVVFGMMVYTGWKLSREAKEARLRSAIQLQDNEQEYMSMNVFKSKRDLPAWVNFPDVEKVEWLNKVLQQVWPFVGQYLEKLLVETIAPSIRGSSSHLQTLEFTKVDFGDKAMKVVGIKAHTENDKGQVLLDLYISYVGNVEINVEVKRYFCKAGVKGIQLHGMMRVILEPLIGDVPIVGAVTMFFIKRPKLDINWTGMTNLLDIPGLNVMSDSMIMDAIASFLVLPNRLTVPLVPDLHVAQLRSPLPRGVVRIHLLEAADLAAKDNYIKGVIAGMSDPYAILRVGPQTFTSHHVDNTSCPKWEEMYEVIVHEVPGQELEIEVYDKDTDQDDFLGRAKLDLGIVKKSRVVDEWFTLKDTPTGRVHLRLEWLALLPSTERLEQVLQRNERVVVSSKTTDPPSAAILAVYLDKAEALPMKKGNKDPSPMVQLSVQDITQESRTCYTTVNPEWEDAFTFFIQDPHKQDIDIQVKDVDRVQSLGSLSIPLSRLLSSPSLSLDQWFQLDKSGPASRVYINAVLRVLWLDEESIPESVSSDLASDPSKDLPQHSSPDPSFATEGLLRIHLVKGQNLVPKDNLMGGMVKGKSDPYAVINIGGGTFTSAVVKGNLNPTWNEMYEVVLTKLPGQELQLELFDKDMDMKDDFMGRLKISLTDIISSHYTDQWYTLNDVKSGRVQLVLEWLSTVSEPERLDQVLHFHSRESYSNKAVPSTGLLFVYVDRAQGLALKKSGKEPKMGVELTLGKQSHKTTVCDRTISPQWDEAFYFLVRDPSKEMLVVKLSHCWTLAMGSVAIPLRELLSEEELVLDQWLNLDGGSPQSQVLLRVQLKVLSPKMCPGATEKSKAAIVPEPSAAPPKQEKDTVQKSTSVDRPGDPIPAPPSIPLPKKAVVQESAPGIVHEEVKKAPPPAPDPTPAPPTPRPPHTSPSAGFAREGVLRILLLEAHKLIAKDNLMGGMVKGKSDPYAKIAVGDAHFKSLVVKENLSPVWNEMYEVALVPHPGQEVQVEVYDKDMDKDDFLGRFKVRMEEIIESQYTDKWFTLNDVKSGGVHLVLEWVPTVTEPGQLEPVLQLQSLQAYTNKAVPSSAILFVYLERASELPLKKSGKEPRAGAELVLGGTTHRTKVCDRSTAPRWDEAVYFLIRDPTTETLVIKLSSGWDEPIGSLVVSMRELLSKPQLVLDQWLNLDGASPQSQVLLRAQLKILHTKMTEGLEELQGAVTGPEEDEEEEEELHAPQTVTAAVKEEPLSVGSAAAPSQPSAGHPEETEPAVATLWEEPRHPDTDPTHVKPAPSPGDQVAEPTESELFTTPTAQPVTATNDELQPSAGLGDLVHATVTSLPPVSVSEHAGVDPGEVQKVAGPVELKPLHTTPTKGFGSEGVLRIHLLEAQNLVAKDNLMGGMVKGKSDPYVKVSVGDAKFKSHVIKENLNPTWNEMYELVLREPAPQEVQFEVYDKDLDSDDFLGRFSIRLADVIRCRYTDEWYTLREVKSGLVHLILEWVPTVSEPVRLDKVMQLQSLQSFRNRTAPSAALLWVFLQSARSLPLKKSGKEPKAGAELVVGETTHRTKVCERSTSPQWNETFHFLVRDPKQEMLIIKLSSAWDQAMGALVVPVRELLSKPELVLDQWLNLDGASPQSQILLRAQLKILDSKMADLIDVGAVPCAASSGGSGNGQVKLSVKHGSKERKLTITVHACRGLLSPSKDPVDSYVSVMLLPDKSKATKKKTSVKKRDLNPEYNEKFEYEVSLEEAKCKCLSVTVKNSSASFRSRDLIGQVQMELAQIDLVSGVTDWFDLQDED